MEKCKVPGLWGDICRSKATRENGQPYCVLFEAATLDNNKGVGAFEETARNLSTLCPRSDKVLQYIEQNKPK